MKRAVPVGALIIFALPSCGSPARAAPQASSITGSVDNPTTTVGRTVTFTFDLAGFNRDIGTLNLDLDSDLADHHTIDGVTMALDGGSPNDCSQDPNNGKYYLCGPIKKTQKAEVVITATPKDAGNFKPDVLFSDGALGHSTTFAGDNAVMGVRETVDPS